MEKYNYDFIADQEPDGNSEWYPAKEVDKEIERLKKEKEWLLNELAIHWRNYGGYSHRETQEIKKRILKLMQKALKEK